MTQLQALVLALLATAVAAAVPPLPVSPGRAGVAAPVEARCPTFSWGGTEGAQGYELVVYRLSDDEDAARPSLRARFPGSVVSWTPELGRCFRRGAAYAWSIRAESPEGPSEWSSPAFFRVAEAPSRDEVAAALRVLRAYQEAGEAFDEPLFEDDGNSPVAGADELRLAAPERVVVAAADSLPPPAGDPRLRVVGEVRTVDDGGEARLWGRGRPDEVVYGRLGPMSADLPCSPDTSDVEFGLSKTSVDWGSAADACPVGSWVCRKSEIAPCNTSRADADNWLACDGSISTFPENNHRGWVADSPSTNLVGGWSVFEDGTEVIGLTCYSLPVWCCWEGEPSP